MNTRRSFLREISDYYEGKLRQFGCTSRGVDWKDDASQKLRFDVLMAASGCPRSGTLLDYGCGFGSLKQYLDAAGIPLQYTGYDISTEMIAEATRAHPDVGWLNVRPESGRFDHAVASGVFNVRLNKDDAQWRDYIANELQYLDSMSAVSFSFNMLTSYSDKPLQRDYLYYADPLYWFDYCKRHFSRFVSLHHDYPLYEFTLAVKKVPDE